MVHYNIRGYRDGPYVKVAAGFLPALAQLILRTKHDVYLAALWFTPALCVYLNRLVTSRPYVFNLTGAMWEMFKDRARSKPLPGLFERVIYPLLLERVLAGSSRIVCNSRFLERTVAGRYEKYRARLGTIYNGIEAERYAAGRRQSITGIDVGDVTVLCVTTLNFEHKSQGLALVLEAFRRVQEARSDVKLLVAAKVAHQKYAAPLEASVRARPWGRSVFFFYNQTNIADLLASSDIFVFATPGNSNDSLPRALLEAQAAGLASVTTDTSGCPEIVADGVTGLVVPYDAGAVAAAILRLAQDRGLRESLGVAGRDRVARVFSWDEMADRYATVFREVAG